MRRSLISRFKEEDVGAVELEEQRRRLTLISPTTVLWDYKKLHKLLKAKGIGVNTIRRVLKVVKQVKVDDGVIDSLVRKGKLDIDELKNVSTIKTISPYLRWFDIRDEE